MLSTRLRQSRRGSYLRAQDTRPNRPDRPTPTPTQRPQPKPKPPPRDNADTKDTKPKNPDKNALWCDPPRHVMQRPFGLHTSPRAEHNVRVETIRCRRASSRLDLSRGSHTFHRRPPAPTFQQRHLHVIRNKTTARLHGLRASTILTVARLGAGTAQQMDFQNVFSPETGRRQMATHYRHTPPELVHQGRQTHVRDTQAPQEPDACRRLYGILRPRRRLLHTRHTGGRQRLLYGKLSRHAV
jgi:hypothetical protein